MALEAAAVGRVLLRVPHPRRTLRLPFTVVLMTPQSQMGAALVFRRELSTATSAHESVMYLGQVLTAIHKLADECIVH
jgi:hypothetical protein